jgi:hypothetical protein
MKIKTKHIVLIIFIIGILYALSQCIVWKTYYPESDFEKDPFLERDPIELALEHHRSANQTKWLGCNGYTVYLPGVPDEILDEADRSEIHRIIGTADALSGEDHIQYNDRAVKFAEVYNQKRMELNKQSQPRK